MVQVASVLVGNQTLQGNYTWAGGSWNSAYTTVIGDQCVLTISTGIDHDLAGHVIENRGRVVWTGGRIRGGAGGSTISNFGLWEASASSGFNQEYGGNGMVFNNSSTFRSTGSTVTYFSVPLIHSGTMEILNGSVAVNIGGTIQEIGRAHV